MTSSSPPRRAPYQITPTGTCASEIAHPYLSGKRLRLTADTAHDLNEQKRAVAGWVREVRMSTMTLEELRDRVLRLTNRRPEALLLRDAWKAHVAGAAPTRESQLWSVWRNQIAPELGELPVIHLTARRMTAWDVAQIAKGYAPKTTRDAFAKIAAAVRASLREGEDLPWRVSAGKYWRPSRRPEPVQERPACGTVEEAERLIAAGLEEDRAQRSGAFGEAYAKRLADLGNRCAVVLLLALRNGEGAGLGWDDLALGGPRPMARIRHQAPDQWRTHFPRWTRPIQPPKGKRTRDVLIHPTALAALLSQRELLDQRGWYREDGPVFPGHEGNRFAGTWRNNANVIRPDHMKRLAANAGLPFPDEWVTHSLRHSLATLENTSGADLRSVQRRTGHSTLRALEGYLHGRSGRALPTSAVRELDVEFDPEHDTDPMAAMVVLPDDEGEPR